MQELFKTVPTQEILDSQRPWVQLPDNMILNTIGFIANKAEVERSLGNMNGIKQKMLNELILELANRN